MVMMTREEYYAQIKEMYAQKYESPSMKAWRSGSDHFERSGDDRWFSEEDRRFREYLMSRNDDDDETWTWTETDLSLDDETDFLEEKSISQFQVPIANSEIVRSIEPGKVDLELERLEVVTDKKEPMEVDISEVEHKTESEGRAEEPPKSVADEVHVQPIELVVRDQAQEARSDVVSSPGVSVTRVGAVETQTCISSRANHVWKPGEFVHPKIQLDWLERADSNHKKESNKNLRNVEDGVKQDKNRFSGDIGAKIFMASEKLHLLQDVFEMVKELLLKTSLVMEQVMRDKKIKFTKQWMFKFKMDSKPARINHILHQEMKPSKSPKSWKFKFQLSLEDTDFVFKMDRWCRAPYVNLETESFLEIEVLQEDVQPVPFAFLHMNANETRYAIRKPANSGTQEPATFQSANAHGMIIRGKDGTVKPNPRHSLLAVQRIWEKETHEVDIIDTNSVLQEEFEQVVNHTPFSVIKLEGLLLLGDESFQIKHKWRFKLLPLILECELCSDRLMFITNYAQQFDISGLMILMTVGTSFTNLRSQLLFKALKWLEITWFSSLQNLEVKVSSKEGDLLQIIWIALGLRVGLSVCRWASLKILKLRRIKGRRRSVLENHRTFVIGFLWLFC